MKISVDGVDLFELSDIQKKVMQNEIPSDIFEEDIKRRLKWLILDHKYVLCLQDLKAEWDPKLAKRYENLPTDPDKYAALVFSQPDYMNRSQRDALNASQ